MSDCTVNLIIDITHSKKISNAAAHALIDAIDPIVRTHVTEAVIETLKRVTNSITSADVTISVRSRKIDEQPN